MRSMLREFAFLLLMLTASVGSAQEAPGGKPAPVGGVLSLLPAPVTTKHTISLRGRALAYDATAGTLSLLGGNGEVTAEVFYVAYTLRPPAGAGEDKRRPVTFVFNGGPGAASAYLHLGALGPRVVATGADGSFLSPPQPVVDNPDTWLDMTDLVFVDPVGTGYSREAPSQKAEDFWGVERDASSMGAFIRLYLQRAERTHSRVYLAGESYGGFRAALLSRTLQEDVGISPSGIVLISPALEFSLVRADDFNPLKWALALPSMAAVKMSRDGLRGDALREALGGVERYALSDYVLALAAGLDAGGRAASGTVAGMLGLPVELVRRHAARVPAEVFAREFARTSGQVLSLYDGTLAGPDISPQSPWQETPDAVLDRSVPVLTSAFVDYVRNELNYRTDISYRLLNKEIAGRWDYGTGPSRQGYAGVMEDLQRARALNPKLGVLIAHGYTDLVTPYLASRYLVAQLPALTGATPITQRVYEGGHMMYLAPQSRAALKADAAALMTATAGGD